MKFKKIKLRVVQTNLDKEIGSLVQHNLDTTFIGLVTSIDNPHCLVNKKVSLFLSSLSTIKIEFYEGDIVYADSETLVRSIPKNIVTWDLTSETIESWDLVKITQRTSVRDLQLGIDTDYSCKLLVDDDDNPVKTKGCIIVCF